MDNKKNGLILAIIVLFGLIFRLYLIFQSHLTFYSDDAIYATIARFWLTGRLNLVFHPTWPPFYPFLSAVIYLFSKNWENSLRIVSALSGVIASVPLYFLAKKALTKVHAVLFTLIVIFSVPFLEFSIIPLSDMLATLLIISAITLAYLGVTENSKKYLYFSSFLMGLTYLTRSEGTMFFGLTLAYLSVYFLLKRKNISTIIFFIFIFFATISPYVIATRIQTGRLSLSQKVSAVLQQKHAFALKNGTTWIQEVDSVKKPNYKSAYFSGGLNIILDNYYTYKRLFRERLLAWVKIYKNFFPTASVFLVLFGGLTFLKKRQFWNTGYLIFIVSVTVPTTILMNSIPEVRYLLWVFPFIIFFIFLAVNNFLSLLKISSTVGAILATILLLSFPFFSLQLLRQPHLLAENFTNKHYKEEVLAASGWILTNFKDPNPKIMMKHEALEFYTDGTTIYLPQDLPVNSVVDYAKGHDVDFIVAWKQELEADKNLFPLLNPKNTFPSIKSVFVYPKNSPMMIIYKILD